MLSVGTKAPNFSLFDTKRAKVSLEEFRGKTVVLAFIPAAFTSVCDKEFCTLRDSTLPDLGATVIGISVDAPFSNAAFAEKTKASFPVLSDYTRETVKAYGLELPDFAGLPGYTASKRAVFVVDGTGTIRYAWVGPNPGVEPDYDEVKKAVAALK